MSEFGKVTSLHSMVRLVEQARSTGRLLQANDDNSLQLASIGSRIFRKLSGIGKSTEWHAQREKETLANIKRAIDYTAKRENELGSADHRKLLALVSAIHVTSGRHKSALENYQAALKHSGSDTQPQGRMSQPVGQPQPSQIGSSDHETDIIGRSFSVDMDESLAKIGNPSGTEWGASLKAILELKLPVSNRLSFGKQAARDEASAVLREQFTRFFENEIGKLKSRFPKDSAIAMEFEANAKSSLKDIITDCFSKDSANSSHVLAQSALKAQYEARKSLIGMRDAVVGPASTTGHAQITPFRDPESGKVAFNIISKAPPIETAVFSGGGMKAAGVGAAIEEFMRFGQYEHVKKLVGSSAGALTSVFLASNMPIEKFNRLNSELASWSSAFGSVDDQPRRIRQYQGLHLGAADGATHSMGLLMALDHESAKSVDQFLDQNRERVAAAVRDGIITEDEARHLLRLHDQDFEAFHRDSRMVTFRDLKLLHLIAPKQFKELSLTGFDPAKQQTQIFDADRTPDLPIAYAARASMAAPLAFSSAAIDGVKYIDGGLGTNQPVDVVHGNKQGVELENSRAKTVLFSFDAGGDTMKALHDPIKRPGPSEHRLFNSWMSLWGKDNASGADADDALRQNQTGPQTMIVYHGDLGSFSFLAGNDRKEFAIAHSRLMMQEQLLLRDNQAMSRVFENVSDVVEALSDDDRSAFLKAHSGIEIPDDRSDMDPVTSATYDLLKELRAHQAG